MSVRRNQTKVGLKDAFAAVNHQTTSRRNQTKVGLKAPLAFHGGIGVGGKKSDQGGIESVLARRIVSVGTHRRNQTKVGLKVPASTVRTVAFETKKSDQGGIESLDTRLLLPQLLFEEIRPRWD